MLKQTLERYTRALDGDAGADNEATAPYGAYAAVYDLQGQSTWSERMVAFTRDLLPRYGVAPRRVLDLACGTGSAALAFAAHGYAVTGVDASETMLAAARRKATDAGASVTWARADMRDFSLPTPVDLVTCFYDSLNYLTDPADLTHAFVQVRAALAPGGLFVCDANTRAGLAADWNDRVWVHEIAGTYFIQHATWDDATGIATLALTCFLPVGAGYRRFEETHRERGYTPDELTAALAAAGLPVRDCFTCLRGVGPTLDPPSEGAHRVVLVAQRAR